MTYLPTAWIDSNNKREKIDYKVLSDSIISIENLDEDSWWDLLDVACNWTCK